MDLCKFQNFHSYIERTLSQKNNTPPSTKYLAIISRTVQAICLWRMEEKNENKTYGELSPACISLNVTKREIDEETWTSELKSTFRFK